MNHRITYLYINFQHNPVSKPRSVKTVYSNLFATKHELHKFATTNSNFEKKDDFRHDHRITYILYQF